MKAFDPRTLFLARHAQHVVLIHFPIALLLVAILFDLLSQWKENTALAGAAYYNLLAAGLSTPFVLASGILAWRWQLEGARLKGNLLSHLVLGITSTILIWLVWWIHRRARQQGRALPLARWPLELLAAICVAVTGHLGGFLSGVNS
jgi:uncharacterized membrane protein